MIFLPIANLVCGQTFPPFSLVIHPIQNDVYVFALCRDNKVRMWLASSYDCVMVSDVLSVSSAARMSSGAGAGGSAGGSLAGPLQV